MFRPLPEKGVRSCLSERDRGFFELWWCGLLTRRGALATLHDVSVKTFGRVKGWL